MIKAGIVGAAGYTAGELIRILLHHPEVELSFALSQSQQGKRIAEVHTDLWGDTTALFTGEMTEEVDVLFFCSGHGKTLPFLEANNIPASTAMIDLSRDFRLQSEAHDFVYGLPELNRTAIQAARHIANPGCFATCIQLGLIPLANAQQLRSEVHITALTGSTGAGQQPRATTHFSWRAQNISVYKAFNHQHLAEIEQSLRVLQPKLFGPLNFVPMRGDFPRGIFASMYLDTDLNLADASEIYHQFYQSHPFTHLIDINPHLKQVVNTNKALIYLQTYEGKLHIISLIDNLLKGASGQAVQNMNLLFGFPETMGLTLKAIAF